MGVRGVGLGLVVVKAYNSFYHGLKSPSSPIPEGEAYICGQQSQGLDLGMVAYQCMVTDHWSVSILLKSDWTCVRRYVVGQRGPCSGFLIPSQALHSAARPNDGTVVGHSVKLPL